MSSCVLDASALLAVINSEPGADVVMAGMAAGAAMSTVNLSEVAAKLIESGFPDIDMLAVLQTFNIEFVPFDEDLAYQAARLRAATRASGSSLGDRASLVLAQQLGVSVYTADRAWHALSVGATVHVIR
jgi:PIN domain nuclease of toxin-antitoxin system